MSKYLPFISCKCITYGRVDTLEEALYSFLIQDYPEDRCELVIVNDYPEQKLIYDHPQVTIYNLDRPFTLIGEKENYAIHRCKGELIAVWDDDDVAMSNHLKNIAQNWSYNTNIIHWKTGVFYNEPRITAITSLGNSGIVYSKDVWEMLGRSPLENAGGDVTFTDKIHALGKQYVKNVSLPEKEASWFYMWGGRGYHLSGQGKDNDTRPNIIERHSAHIEKERKRGNIPTGLINLKPKWNKDYATMLSDFVREKSSGGMPSK